MKVSNKMESNEREEDERLLKEMKDKELKSKKKVKVSLLKTDKRAKGSKLSHLLPLLI